MKIKLGAYDIVALGCGAPLLPLVLEPLAGVNSLTRLRASVTARLSQIYLPQLSPDTYLLAMPKGRLSICERCISSGRDSNSVLRIRNQRR